MKVRVLWLTVLVAVLCPAVPALADPGDVIVRFRASAGADDRGTARRAAKVRRVHGLPVGGLELASPEAGVTAAAAAARLERDADVLYAEPDVARRALAVPSDPFFGAEWGLSNTGQTVGGTGGTPDADVDAPEAWDLTTGSPSAVVAVADTGIDAAHPDLAPNLWRNADEIAGNGIDDDGNGFVDDVRGWDFVEGDAAPQDEEGHGTHVAGTIAARGDDGTGVAGVAWTAAILPLRILGPAGEGSVSDAIRAYDYAAAAGARVINLSLGGPSGSRAERDAIAAHPGLLFVVAAGNEGADNDSVATYPCNYDLANVVCVAATDQSDALAGFSNHGVRTVDLAAPGVSIASTYPGERWALMDGTSMATPHVSGVAALLVAAAPAATVPDLRAALLGGVDKKLSLSGFTATAGRLNALGALQALGATANDAREGGTQPSGGATTEPSGGGTSAPPGGDASAPPAEETPAPSGTSAPPGGDTSAPPGDATSTAPSGPAATTTTPLAPPDRSAPFATFTASPSRDLGAFVRRRAMRVSLRCNEPCTVRVELRRGTHLLGRATKAVATRATVTLRLGARDRARLRRLRVVRLTLRVRAVDDAGNARTATRRLTLRRR